MSLQGFSFEDLHAEYVRRLQMFGRGKILTTTISESKYNQNKYELETICSFCNQGNMHLLEVGYQPGPNIYGKRTVDYYLKCDQCVYSRVHSDYDN